MTFGKRFLTVSWKVIKNSHITEWVALMLERISFLAEAVNKRRKENFLTQAELLIESENSPSASFIHQALFVPRIHELHHMAVIACVYLSVFV